MMRFASLTITVAFAAAAAPVSATWSIVTADTETQEIAVASATCVAGLDLRAFTPAVVVGKGAGAAQSLVDSSGQRRMIMFDGFNAGLSSDQILLQLQALAQEPNHQHGLADTGGDSATSTGAQNGAHASGVVGRFGTTYYAIQGNVLTGSPVVTQAEIALTTTAGDLPDRVMAAMEAARVQGGDGRCSCSPAAPTSCGAPPAMFTKSAHVGYLIITRMGDTDDPACTFQGCADGDYYLSLNVANQQAIDPDPVLTLRTLFDAARSGLIGDPDAIATGVRFLSSSTDFVLHIVPRDWQQTALPSGTVTNLSVVHAPESDQATTIGTPVANPDGSFDVPLDRTLPSGNDVFLVDLTFTGDQIRLPPRRTSLGIVFADGFESGDPSAWSSVVP